MKTPPIDGSLLAQQWKQWCESKEGKSCLEQSILKDGNQMTYLKNRLWRAFFAGQKTMESTNQ